MKNSKPENKWKEMSLTEKNYRGKVIVKSFKLENGWKKNALAKEKTVAENSGENLQTGIWAKKWG